MNSTPSLTGPILSLLHIRLIAIDVLLLIEPAPSLLVASPVPIFKFADLPCCVETFRVQTSHLALTSTTMQTRYTAMYSVVGSRPAGRWVHTRKRKVRSVLNMVVHDMGRHIGSSDFSTVSFGRNSHLPLLGARPGTPEYLSSRSVLNVIWIQNSF